ncbi:MAG: hypothetical protein ABI972_00340 [Acidobacteriota bacterium]
MVQLRMLSCVALATVCAGAQTGKPAGPVVQLEFRCLWWSEGQMAGLNPNSPPAKTTEVRIQQWEYSDPVGVPHPDVVDAVLLLPEAGAGGLAGVEVEFTVQWKIGRYGKRGTAVWGPIQPARKMAAGMEVRLPVNLKAKMDALDKQNRWPFALRVTAVVQRTGAAAPLGRARAEFPIRQGD